MTKKYFNIGTVWDAVQWTGDNLEEVNKLLQVSTYYILINKELNIAYLINSKDKEVKSRIHKGDFIIKDTITGEAHVIEDWWFKDHYEEKKSFVNEKKYAVSNTPSKKKYHVHVYKVEAMYEMDIEADSEEEARALALKADKKYTEADCHSIALAWENEQKRNT